ELADQLGRILQVGVDQDRGVTGAVIESGAERRLMSEVARQGEDLDAFVTAGQLLQEGGGAVQAAVVHEEYLHVAGQGPERGGEPLVEGRQDLLLVVDRNDDGQLPHCGFAPDGRCYFKPLAVGKRWKIGP